jgi:5-methylcytosine-specific restriction endonuclease McrA
MSQVLVLNKHFYAVAVTDWRRAMGLLYLDHARVVDESWRTYDFAGWLETSEQIGDHSAGFIRTPSQKIAMPEVITLRIFGKVPKREVTFTRRNIYLHYGFQCSYCGQELPAKQLNLDHVMPKSRGGKTDWTNVVPSCIPCNKRKANYLPKEAGMRLLKQPARPKAHAGASFFLRYKSGARRSWRQFIDKANWEAGWE